MNRIYKLDGLRGLFALFVVLFHLNKNNAPLFIVNNFFVRESYIFVDFFFILSGYVIALTYDQHIQNAKDFLHFIKKRFIRLYPLLLFSTCMYWYFVHPHWNKKSQLLALDTLLLTNSTPILGTGIGMNYPSWSISSEMISYLFFGSCSLIGIKLNKQWLVGIITLACFGFLYTQQNYFLLGDYGFIRGLACFNLGYFIFSLPFKNIKLPKAFEWVVLASIIGIMYAHFHLNQNNPYRIVLSLFIPINFAIAIFILIHTNGIIGTFLQSKPMLFLGKISFSVYLNHAFIIGYFIPKFYQWIQFTNGENKKTLSVILLMLLLLVYSWGTQFLIENKLGKKISSWTN
jgi:peptidoglycan/LPS O-acetylase OafA/YrhL